MIEALSAFHFERPLWLLLLLPAVALWLVERRGADAAEVWRRTIDPELLRHLLVGAGRRALVTPNGALLAAWVVGSIAVAGPAWQREPSPFADAKPPVVVVLKVTQSMTTTDLAPTRLDRARQKLSDLLAARDGAAAGLVAYSGSSHLVLPPTADRDVVDALAKALAPEIMPKEGDDLAAAVALADRVLAGNGHGGSILVVADGVSGERIGTLAAPAHPVTIVAMLPPDGADRGLAEAARALNADLVRTSVDQSDVAALARRLDRAERIADVAGEGRRWIEAGYWLTPLLALMALLWFRRGWVLA